MVALGSAAISLPFSASLERPAAPGAYCSKKPGNRHLELEAVGTSHHDIVQNRGERQHEVWPDNAGAPNRFPLSLRLLAGAADLYVRDYERIYGLRSVVFR